MDIFEPVQGYSLFLLMRRFVQLEMEMRNSILKAPLVVDEQQHPSLQGLGRVADLLAEFTPAFQAYTYDSKPWVAKQAAL